MCNTLRTATTVAVVGILELWTGATALAAGGIRVQILDRDGLPVPEVAVSARRLDSAAAPDSRGMAAMNQHDLAFDPHLLIVDTGTEVRFPNDDDVRHHVYSFSPARQFDFTIDSESVAEALRFDVPGIVTLGCNIHDDMLAYIVVVDTPHFASTEADGIAELVGLESGRYELTIWTSRVATKHLPAPIEVQVADDELATREHRFAAKLYPPHRHSATSLHWAHY
jgi:plastocyanin